MRLSLPYPQLTLCGTATFVPCLLWTERSETAHCHFTHWQPCGGARFDVSGAKPVFPYPPGPGVENSKTFNRQLTGALDLLTGLSHDTPMFMTRLRPMRR